MRTTRASGAERFLSKLRTLLDQGDDGLIMWTTNSDTTFKVVDQARFLEALATPECGCLTWSSFVQLTKAYAFTSTREGQTQGLFSHPDLRRGSPRELREISPTGQPRKPIPSTKAKTKLKVPGETRVTDDPVGKSKDAAATAGSRARSHKRPREEATETTSQHGGNERRQAPRPSEESTPRMPFATPGRKAPSSGPKWIPPPCCVACGGSAGPRAFCRACGAEYHPGCADLPRSAQWDTRWICDVCRPELGQSRSSRCSPSTDRKMSPTVVSSVLARLTSTLSQEGVVAGADRNPLAGILGGGDAGDMAGKLLSWATKGAFANTPLADVAGAGGEQMHAADSGREQNPSPVPDGDVPGISSKCASCGFAACLSSAYTNPAPSPKAWVCAACMFPTQMRRVEALARARDSALTSRRKSKQGQNDAKSGEEVVKRGQGCPRPPGAASRPSTPRNRNKKPDRCAASVCRIRRVGKTGRCASCDAEFHIKCMVPPRSSVPTKARPYYCLVCREAYADEVKKSNRRTRTPRKVMGPGR